MNEFIEFLLIVGLIFNFGISVLSEIPRPRGVSVSHANLYPPADTFTCLDGLKTIKFIQVNDDFCDCADGSDEPGTSACPSGTFHCANLGHRARDIPSSRVNDGICDCCDASDEYSSYASCVNICDELGREERDHKKQMAELSRKGNQLRSELMKRGEELKTERKEKLTDLQHRMQDAEQAKEVKNRVKEEAERLENDALAVYRQIQEEQKKEKMEKEAESNRQEAEDTFAKFDSDNDGVIHLSEIQTRIAFDKNRDGAVSEEEARYFLGESDQVDKETFITVAWPNIKPYLMVDSGLFTPPKTEQEEHDHEEDHDVPTDDTETTETEEPTADEEDEEAETEAEGEVDPPNTEYDPETQRLIEEANNARNAFSEADRTVRELETQIRNIKELLEKDYGPEQEFAPLDGECYNFEDREYVYKLCPFDRASQQPISGGSETRLGSWENWSGTEYKYSAMMYSNGASCWNGPQRSAAVDVECGLEHKLVSVTEPNRCEYHFVFHTPAACKLTEETNDTHDEL